MRTGLIHAALAATLTLLGAEARTLSAGGGFDPPDAVARARATADNDESGPATFTSVATASCSAQSFFPAFKDLSSNYTKAIDQVIEFVCARDWDGNYTEAAEAMKNFTVPVGKVLASTKASCTTTVSGSGSAQGCAHVKASALDFEAALADVHVDACDAAFERHCSCAKKWKWEFSDIEEFQALVAAAYADADVIACTSGNESATEEAFVECFATVIADTFAFSAARSSAEAGCYRGYSNDKARGAVEAMTAELVLECKVNSTETKTGTPAKGKPAPKPAPKPADDVTITVTRTVDTDGDATATATGTGTVSGTRSGGSTVEQTISLPE